MQNAVQVTFRNMPHSDKIERIVRERADKLDHFHPALMGCRVVIEPSGHRQKQGAAYQVHIDMTVKGAELVVGGDGTEHGEPDVVAAVNEAFDVARRRLMDHAAKLRGEVKGRETPPHRS